MAQKTAISAGAIVLREIDGQLKVAMAQRQRTVKTWVLPKGHVEAGETIEQAALREIHEEAGLNNLQLIRLLGSVVRQSVKNNGDVVQKTIYYYLAYSPTSKQIQAPTDALFSDVGWFSPQEAIDLLPYESERAFFREHLAPLFT